jgi:hypothetical protein
MEEPANIPEHIDLSYVESECEHAGKIAVIGEDNILWVFDCAQRTVASLTLAEALTMSLDEKEELLGEF